MLKEKLKDYKIILASGSPRRQQFFRDLDLDFEVRLKEVDEVFSDNLKHHEITDFLALLKSNAFDTDLADNELLVTSDTIVWYNEKALGKPKDYNDAFEILKSLSNATHEVITSVCFKTNQKTTLIHEVSTVTFKPLTDEMIRYYILNYKPFDKAGAYGIQEWIGFVGVIKIEGSYSNIMGLPVERVFDYFQQLP
jgi:septum formation protein